MSQEIESLRQQLAISEAEGLEQARLLGMSGEREAALLAEIDRLHNQLAAANAELARKQDRDSQYSNVCCKLSAKENEVVQLRQQLVASQAREVQLREALNQGYGWAPIGSTSKQIMGLALALPTDTTALSAMITKAGEVMRERSKRACEKRAEDRFNECGTREDDTGACYYSGRHGEVLSAMDEEDDDCANAIRALPGVTLEDLK